MRKCLLFLILFASGNAYSQKGKLKKNPPGTIQVNDTLYVDITEVANVHWREYIYYLSQFDSLNQEFALPDTTVWRPETGFYDGSHDFYFRHPGFNDYPVVGVSYKQAIAYCQWRTIAANHNVYCKENNITDWRSHLKDSFPIRFYYRLLTREEWEMIATGKHDPEKFPYGYDSTYQKWKGKYSKAFNCLYPDSLENKRAFDTAPIRSFWQNDSGVYNMIGNVAEMVLEEGIAKGGGFDHPLDSCKIVLDQHYAKPEKWLGFRCVAVMVK